jgi:hypothetical protein
VKTYKDLYPQVYDFANLYWAYRRARVGQHHRVGGKPMLILDEAGCQASRDSAGA